MTLLDAPAAPRSRLMSGAATGHEICPKFGRDLGDDGTDHITGASRPSSWARLVLWQANNLVAAQHPANLQLRWHAADLSDQRSGHHRN
jgi:hypothetical protein